MGIKSWLTLVAYLFVAIASIVAIFRPEGKIWIIIFVFSAIVSLILAVTRMRNSKQMSDRIRYLEEHHTSFEYEEDEEEMTILEGKE